MPKGKAVFGYMHPCGACEQQCRGIGRGQQQPGKAQAKADGRGQWPAQIYEGIVFAFDKAAVSAENGPFMDMEAAVFYGKQGGLDAGDFGFLRHTAQGVAKFMERGYRDREKGQAQQGKHQTVGIYADPKQHEASGI